MKREWKPGDMAMVTYGGRQNIALVRRRVEARGELEFAYGAGGYDMVSDAEVADSARPLVAIDPEDEQQVARLFARYLNQAAPRMSSDAPIRTTGIDYLQAALREFANPTPPKLEEPQGLGAVVEDAEGLCWVRVEPFNPSNSADIIAWRSRVAQAAPKEFSWPNVHAVRVLSDGVTP